MSRLIDVARLRILRRSCRHTGKVRRPPWWRLRAPSPQDSSGNDRRIVPILRFLPTVLIVCGGLLLHKTPLGGQLLSLAAVVMVIARADQRRQALDADPGLVLLASLPVSGRDIIRHQLQQRWYPQFLTLVEAAGFWAVAWNVHGNIAWWWLPVIAITHALLIEAVVLLLLPYWRTLGCLSYPLVFVTIWAISAEDDSPAVRQLLESGLFLLAWVTPWGWLNQLASELPRNPYLGASIVMLAFVALLLIKWAWTRLESGWQVPVIFREALGRPEQTWGLSDEDAGDVERTPTTSSQGNFDSASSPSVPEDSAALVSALATARTKIDGACLFPFGWPGWQAHAWCEVADRRLADLLMPVGVGPVQWRWALFAASAPALCIVAEVSLAWGLMVIAVALLLQRMFKRGLFVIALAVYALMQPESAPLLGGGLPCVAAVLMGMPLLGGIWNGLPMGRQVLGSVPRSWWRLMRIMLLLTGMRLLIALPIMGLVLAVLGMGVDGIPAAFAATGLVCVVLWFPWICALRLIQRTVNGVDISLGHAGMTTLNVLCIALHLVTALMILGGLMYPMMNNEDWSAFAILFVVGGICLSLITTAGHVALLRYAYRRVVDLV